MGTTRPDCWCKGLISTGIRAGQRRQSSRWADDAPGWFGGRKGVYGELFGMPQGERASFTYWNLIVDASDMESATGPRGRFESVGAAIEFEGTCML
ncbi:hypothetical protein SBA4_2390003 [Candidatus Sulfopaludibacter sp. SbA4]|nr:hypothetical protein SBA4_2390003 [Candidatus Sulfopaludibacter sp. SbA4]